MEKPIYIVLQAYGHKDYCNEAIYLILSYLKVYPDWKLKNVYFVIYTDVQENFEILKEYPNKFLFQKVTPSDIKTWQGTPPFVHRAKIKIIQDFFGKYDGHLLYLDTDTYFLKNPDFIFEQIANRNRVMHIAEGKISSKANPIFKKTYRFLNANKFTFEGKGLQIPLNTVMWNAGVLGIPNNQSNLPNQVLELSDEMYKKYQKHIIEQLAFSYLMNLDQQVMGCSDFIFHYWDFKQFRGILNKFFEHYQALSLEQLSSKIYQVISTDFDVDKRKYYSSSFFGKTLRKIRGKKWIIPEPKFD